MSLFTWLQHRTRRFASQRRAAHGSPRRQTTFRPRLEVLEGRDVPSTLTVTNNLNSGAGSLGYEIDKAHKGDTIVFAPSLDGQTIYGSFDISKSLTIQGPGAGLLTIAEHGPDSGVRVFKIEKSTYVTLSGLTITGGNAIAVRGYFTAYDGEGGGILNLGTLTVSGCSVSDNFANNYYGDGYGAGIYNAGTLTVTNSTVSGNSANDYGYIGTYMGFGGGIYNAGSLTVSGCTLSGNVTDRNGGGIFNAGTATVSTSTLSSNSALDGGGIYNAGPASALTVSNSVFSGNSAPTAQNGPNIFGTYTDGGGNTFS